jgi:hypothetical protein
LQFLPTYYHANDEPSQAHALPQQSKLPSLFADPDDYAIYIILAASRVKLAESYVCTLF